MIALTGTPVLTTLRLTLRAPQARDLPAFTAYMTSPRAAFTGGPTNAAGAFETFSMVIGHWALRGHGLFAVTLTDTGETIGLAGHLSPPAWPEPELAWNLWDAAHEGFGYATEAAFAVRDHAFGALGWTTAISMIARDNHRSIALARRLDATPERDDEIFGKPMTIWRHPQPARGEKK
ncbi:GNAT family N-acetyltransferase [Xinfangfangia sp. D13-10-4-6]|uniref:GNAT family N-acetyltransferase n=1 Tax=Pseudogemmobacter hezensis TaxID=2737662 RepID=UPI001553A2B9|nr:GNAT family N-acetyltransferase [Pseudogemmobacter hezensis]NPD15442.1 GNAT family N-acetyltransferase [Pseudogemmobacter hezensis]